jgi:hypothetical protein
MLSPGILFLLALFSLYYLIKGIRGIISKKNKNKKVAVRKEGFKFIVLGVIGFVLIFIYWPR